MNPIHTHTPMEIMIAVDGSEHAWAAVELLRDLPVCEARPGSSISALAVMLPRDAAEHRVRELLLENTQVKLQPTGVKISTELLVGYPAEMLMQYTEAHHPDLIVLGAKGLRATLGILLGGVAQGMVEYATCPVLVVRSPYTGLQRALLAVDGSIYSQRAVQFLAEFPLPAHVEVQVVHVLPPFPKTGAHPYEPSDSPGLPRETSLVGKEEAFQPDIEEESLGNEILAQAIEILRSMGKKACANLIRGDAATEIIEHVKKNHIDLIVVGSRGLSGVKGWLLGSVSRKLVHYAGCSVLVVKQEAGQ